MELEAAGSAAETLEQQTAAALAEGQTEESFPHEVMTDSGGDWQLVGDLHSDLLPLQLAHGRVPEYRSPGGVLQSVHGTGLWCQPPELHGFAESVPEGDPLLDWHNSPPVVAQVRPYKGPRGGSGGDGGAGSPLAWCGTVNINGVVAGTLNIQQLLLQRRLSLGEVVQFLCVLFILGYKYRRRVLIASKCHIQSVDVFFG